ncbi:MAG TPA: alkaline shock response membrane anchor protein AmaP, partial [Pseudonocardia sp.]|nr:alkaline shock response membrane anchor protein AmaP [Pseudonocardia sp.]
AVTPAPSPRALRKRSRAAAARSAAGERSTVALLGLVLLALGVLVTLLSLGVFGAARAGLPVVDPVVLDALRSQPVVARIAAIVAGLLLLVLGLLRVVRSLRPEPRPDLVLDPGPQTAISISSSAAADAVAAQAGTLPGVCRAKVRLVGTRTAPAARITVWLDEDADIREVCRRLDEVLASARDCFGLAAMPVAVRLELDSGPGQNSRVA